MNSPFNPTPFSQMVSDDAQRSLEAATSSDSSLCPRLAPDTVDVVIAREEAKLARHIEETTILASKSLDIPRDAYQLPRVRPANRRFTPRRTTITRSPAH